MTGLATASPCTLAERLRLIVITDRALAARGETRRYTGSGEAPGGQDDLKEEWQRDAPEKQRRAKWFGTNTSTPERSSDFRHKAPSRLCPVISVVRAALRAGAPAVQFREKQLPPRDLIYVARQIREATLAAGALFFVNDRLDVALAVGSDGVHLGPDDLPVAAARRIAPGGFLIGASARTPSAARAAVADGADYIGCGPVFATTTKPEAGNAIGPARLAAVAAAVSVPVVAVGGVTASGVSAALAAGAKGCAVIGAVMHSPEPAKSVAELLRAISSRQRSAKGTPLPRNKPVVRTPNFRQIQNAPSGNS